MTNWKTYKITRIDNRERFIMIYLDGKVPWGDYKNPGKEGGFTDDSVSVFDCPPFNTWRIDDYIEIDLDKSVNCRWALPIADTSIVRKASSSSVATRNAMINASSANPTALAVTRDLADRVDRGEETNFKYEIEDNGIKHSWIYKRN